MTPPAEAASSASGLVGVVAVGVLVLANAVFVAAEFAFVGSRRTRLEEMANAGNGRAALAQRALLRLDRYISATQLGITLASLGLGWIGEPALAGMIEGAFRGLPSPIDAIARHGVASAIAFSIITILHIVLGELVPKALALLYPEDVSSWLAAPLMGFAWVMAAPIFVLNGTANWLLNLLKINPPGESERLHSPEEIRMLVEQSHEGGTLHRGDARMLEGVFEFSEKSAEEVMTPRTDIIALDVTMTIGEAADRVCDAQRSRYPVHEDTLDLIVGIVHAKDILARLRTGKDGTLRDILRPATFVPATKEVEDVLTDMKRLKTHMVIVLDEHGGTLGLVTMEDLLEEIVGEIADEYDVPDAKPAAGPSERIIDGATSIADFNAHYDAKLDDSYYNTVGGWVFGQLGRLPKEGDVVATDGFVFEVRAMEGRRIATLVVRATGSARGGKLAEQRQP